MRVGRPLHLFRVHLFRVHLFRAREPHPVAESTAVGSSGAVGPSGGGRGPRVGLRSAAVLSAFALLAVFGSAPEAGAGACDGGSADSEPEGRPYEPGSEQLDPSQQKYEARTTINANGQRERCECTAGRIWHWGMSPDAIASLKAAMDGKEALAFHNYGQFGVPPEQVPVQARTIWFRTTWRSRDEQVCLRAVFGSGAARPGTSKHEWGLAVDLEDWGPRSYGVDAGFLRANGWCSTVRSEPWHFEYRPQLQRLGQAGRCIK